MEVFLEVFAVYVLFLEVFYATKERLQKAMFSLCFFYSW